MIVPYDRVHGNSPPITSAPGWQHGGLTVLIRPLAPYLAPVGQSRFSAWRMPISASAPSRSKAALSMGAIRRTAPLKVNSAV